MKIAQILHNPTSGNADHDKEGLVDLVKKAGFEVRYASTHEEGWQNFDSGETDIIFLAGGDGTVHKLAEHLLNSKQSAMQIPIRLLPLGTANNIAKTLALSTSLDEGIASEEKIMGFDYGKIEGLEEKFFIESVGLGIFPELIARMKETDVESENASEKLKNTQKLLLDIVRKYPAKKSRMEFDGIKVEGSFLLVELMNIKYIGPNFELAPDNYPGNSYFSLVMIPEENRKALEIYLEEMIQGRTASAAQRSFTRTLQVQKVKLEWYDSLVHVDDQLIRDYRGQSFTAEIQPSAFRFVVPF